MSDLETRIERAQSNHDLAARCAESEADEAIGARACGLTGRAEQSERLATRFAEDAAVWAATVGRLTAELADPLRADGACLTLAGGRYDGGAS